MSPEGNAPRHRGCVLPSAFCPGASRRSIKRMQRPAVPASKLACPPAAERKYMKAKIKYTDKPIGKVKVISDFLPSPEELVLKDETVKVTIALSKASVEFFKKEAKKHNTQYQKMIRRLLDEYAARRP